ncbi:MAG: tyrosine-type recombinase/integrase [Bacteroidota bacterium]
MANINFYLKSGKQNKLGEKSIVMRITFDMQRTIIFTKCMIHPKFWNANKQLVRPPTQREPENNHVFINEMIRTYRNKVEKAIQEALENNLTLSEAYFKNCLVNKHTRKIRKGFFEWMDDYIESGRPQKAPRTITGYITVKNFLKAFEEDTHYNIDLNAIDMNFYDSLKKYAFLKRRIQDNYLAKIINVLKSFLTWAKDRDAKVSDHYFKFSAPEREKDIIFLTIEELMTLYRFKFPNKKHEKARDLYCFGCFTGLRVSDIQELRREHIKEGSIHKTIRKTKVSEIIPLNQFSEEILKKYDDGGDRPLPVISSQKLNDYIKECCKKAEINDPISITRFFGGKTEVLTFPKYELITTHTARKTFLTNSILLGMNYMAARGISGHKRDKNFNRYVKIAEDFKQKEMDRTWGQLENRK